MKIYIASSKRNENSIEVANLLRESGHEVYDFKHRPAGISQHRNIAEALSRCDACVLVLPCGDVAHAEAGWMEGAGKRVIVYDPLLHETAERHGLFDTVCHTLEELQACLPALHKTLWRTSDGSQLRIYKPRQLAWGLIGGAFVISLIGGFFTYLGSGLLHTSLLCLAGYLIYGFAATWGACQPLTKRQNRWLTVIYILCVLLVVYWAAWLTCDEIEFTTSGIWLKAKGAGSDKLPWGIIALLLPISSFFGWFLTYFFYALFMPPSHVVPTTGGDFSSGSDILTAVGGAWLFDKMIHGKPKRHDHKLGSFWADHDDDGNYDPGAWRRKYDSQR